MNELVGRAVRVAWRRTLKELSTSIGEQFTVRGIVELGGEVWMHLEPLQTESSSVWCRLADIAAIYPEPQKLSPSARKLPESPTLRESRELIDRQLVEQALQRHKGKISPAASDLGISRPTMYQFMAKFGLREQGSPKNTRASL